MSSKKQFCHFCNEPIEDDVAHDPVVCEKTELLKGREEIKRLKLSIKDWKDAWFHLREIIGEQWWWHPAISDDTLLEYIRKYQRRIREKS